MTTKTLDHLWVADEGKPSARLDDLLDGAAELVREVSEDGEDDGPGQHRGQGVRRGDDQGVPVAVVPEPAHCEYVTAIHSSNEEYEPVVGGVGDDDAEADPEAEEALRDGRVPDPGLQQPLPLRREEEGEAGGGPGQREAAHQQHRQHQVREQRREVGHLARALHTWQ